MLATVELKPGTNVQVNLSQPIDLSIPMRAGSGQVSAWYVDPISIEPVRGEGFVGAVDQGGAVNFRNIQFNPHGHGTHTECVGHISPDLQSINQELKTYFFSAQVVSVEPEQQGEDQIITKAQLAPLMDAEPAQALILRTLPNNEAKRTRNYSSTNPPYLEEAAALHIRKKGIQHLLLDLPSVDREVDGGKLLSHRAFWNYPENPRLDATITELIYVPDTVGDGLYLLNIQFAPFENDAAPSRPVLYKILE